MAVVDSAHPYVALPYYDARLIRLARRQGLTAWTIRLAADEAALLGGLLLSTSDVRVANLLFVLTSLTLLLISGCYRRRLSLSVLDETPRLLLPIASALLLIAALSPFTEVPSTLFLQAFVSGGALLAGRATSYAVIRSSRRQGRLGERTVIVGAGHVGVDLYRQLHEHPEYGLTPIGIVDDVPPEEGLPLIGSIAQLERIIEVHDARRVIIAFGPTGEQEMLQTLRAAALMDVEVHVVPRFFELGLAPTGPDVDFVWGVPLFRIRRSALREIVWRSKRVLDAAVATVLLLLLAPVLGVVALLVRVSSPGPVLFRQVRVGQSGRLIEVLKFRTLHVNSDSNVTWSVENDPRQTGVGKWLRRLSLDELPQLWNVLRGDMSLVGPRPERPLFVNQFSAQIAGYSDRHRLPVGLTGLAQVHGLRGDTSIEERARFDNYYIEHWTPWVDIKITLRTVAAVIRDAIHIATRRGEAGERDEQADALRTHVAVDEPAADVIELPRT